MMYRPWSVTDFEKDSLDYKLLDLKTSGTTFEWELGFTPERSQTDPFSDKNRYFRIIPSSRIVCMARRYRISMVVDVSGSMRVVEQIKDKCRTLVAYVFETMCKCLDGMSRTYCITNSVTGHISKISPEIYLTALAEYGKSYNDPGSSNPSRRPMKHPIHVLVQDFLISGANLNDLVERLSDALDQYENALTSMIQADAFHIHQDDRFHHYNELLNPHHDGHNEEISFEPSPLNSLEHGLWSLRLLQSRSRPAIIFLTDGVANPIKGGEFIYRDVCRRLTKENVFVTLIQIGLVDGYTIGTNFGHVVDSEGMEFLATAANGKLTFAVNCDYLDPVSSDTLIPPNFYHFHFLTRDWHFTEDFRDRVTSNQTALNAEDTEQNERRTPDLSQVARNVLSTILTYQVPTLQAQPSQLIICEFKNYLLRVTVGQAVNARLQEGFSVSFLKLREVNAAVYKAEVLLVKPWLPKVWILYAVKFNWNRSAGDVLSVKQFEKANSLGRLKFPRAELKILADLDFVLMSTSLERAEDGGERLPHLLSQMVGIAEVDELMRAVASFDSDAATANIPHVDIKNQPLIGSSGMSNLLADPGAPDLSYVWQLITQIMLRKPLSLEDWETDIILKPSFAHKVVTGLSPYGSATRRLMRNDRVETGAEAGKSLAGPRLPSAMLHLVHLLMNWSSFSMRRLLFIKKYPQDYPVGFVMLRLVPETEFVVSSFSYSGGALPLSVQLQVDTAQWP
ncbi:hypothetical protein DFJ73DRAFT_244118 [Zopfochytrium polystomum]|nr:hypothetical protein DFJ73DRAFT_244118 [Zopfochytrium polystomum]